MFANPQRTTSALLNLILTYILCSKYITLQASQPGENERVRLRVPRAMAQKRTCISDKPYILGEIWESRVTTSKITYIIWVIIMDSSDTCLLGLTYTGCLIASSSGNQIHRHNCWFLKKTFSSNSGLVNCCPLLMLGLYPTLCSQAQLKNNPGIKDGTEVVCHHAPGSPNDSHPGQARSPDRCSQPWLGAGKLCDMPAVHRKDVISGEPTALLIRGSCGKPVGCWS